MLFLGNRLYFDHAELEGIEELAMDEGKSVVETIEHLLNERDPDFVDVMTKAFGGFELFKLDAPDADAKFGEIGKPRHPTVH